MQSSIDLDQIATALKQEWEHAKREHQQKQQLPFKERVLCGVSWPALSLKNQEDIRDRSLLTLSSRHPLHDGISRGDVVYLSPKESSSPKISGTCIECDEYSCVFETSKIDVQPRWIVHSPVVLTKDFDERTFQRYERGLERLKGIESPLKQNLLRGYEAPHLPNHSISFPTLNESQSRAAKLSLAAPHLGLIHGPPGTGKTHTAVEIAMELLRAGKMVWMLAESNAAADHLTFSLGKKNRDILRVGSRYRIGKHVQTYSFHHQMDSHPQQKALHILYKELHSVSGKERGQTYKQIRTLKKQMKQQLFQNAEIIISTLGSIGNFVKDLPPCDVAIVDEATQAISPAILAIVPFITKIVLIGDPKQLGPVVTMSGNILEQDLFSLLLSGENAPLLSEQYRMNDQIMGLISDNYSIFKAHKSVAKQRIFSGDHVFSRPIIWIDTVGDVTGENQDPVTHSFFNPTELSVTQKVINRLVNEGLGNEQIAIITPYSAQKIAFQNIFPNIECNSVNAFQGREKEVILCSFVRSNHDGNIGFVSDPRRLLVALSRARSLWIGIGDSATLGQHKIFISLFQRMEQLEFDWQIAWDWIEY